MIRSFQFWKSQYCKGIDFVITKIAVRLVRTFLQLLTYLKCSCNDQMGKNPWKNKKKRKKSYERLKGLFKKSTFTWNFQFLSLFPLVFSCSFYMYPPSPQGMFPLVSYPLPPFSKKSSATLMTLISNKKIGGWKEKKIYFVVNSM